MRKMMVMAGIAIGLVVSATNGSNSEAATKIMSKEQAAKKIAVAQKRAVSQKKVVKVTVRFKSSKKAVAKNVRMIEKKVAAKEWGPLTKIKHTTAWDDPAFPCDIYYSSNAIGKWFTIGLSYKETGTRVRASVKNGVATLSYKFNGKNKDARWDFKQYPYERKIYDYLTSMTKGKSQKYKIGFVECFLGYRHWYSDDIDTSPEKIWKGKAHGQCSARANMVCYYMKMAGVKHVAFVDEPDNPAGAHALNAVRLQDGRIYFFDLHSYLDYQKVDLSTAGEEELFNGVFSSDRDNREQSTGKYILTWEDGKIEKIGEIYEEETYYSKYGW